MRNNAGRWSRVCLLAAALVAGGSAIASGSARESAGHVAPSASAAGQAWVGAWSTTPVVGSSGFTDQTLREIVHTSAGGDQLRIRLTNAFGTDGLVVDDVSVGLRESGAALAAGTERPVTFGGARSVTIPAGAEVFSEPVRLAVPAERDLAVSLHVPGPTGPATRHPGAYTTSYAATGDHAGDAGPDAFTSSLSSWYLLDGVDVRAGQVAGAVVAFGDSITDGTNSTVDADRRYPDDLARRLLAGPPGRRLAVLNEGASGNRLLTDAGSSGVSAQARFDRDVLGQTGVRSVILLEGINDIGHNLSAVSGQPVTAHDIIEAQSNLIRAAHEHRLRIIGATLTPIGGSKYDSPEAEAKRQAVNAWIRTSGAYDGVVDFDQAVRDPAQPNRYLPAYDSGDHLHPNDTGYQVMADAIDLDQLYHGSP
jgi:lysophospholipase L1-like esterase